MIRGILVLLLVGGTVLGFIAWTVIRAEDPARRVFKWILTVPALFLLFGVAGRLVGQGGYGGAFGGIPMAAVAGLLLAIIWRHDIASFFARPIASLYDGGSEPPELKPYYSTAQAHQKKGKYVEAVAEIRKQLSRFPTDVEGNLLLAQIQAENLNDLSGAELTIQRFIEQPGHAPRNVVYALYSMADWYIKPGHDPESARRQLEKIIELYPESEFSLGAAQRIAHLTSTADLIARGEANPIAVPQREQRVGLVHAYESPAPTEEDPAQQASKLVKHLEQHPLDTEVREKLAIIYLDHYNRLDLAMDQLEQMIGQPHQPAKQIVHWLNLMADLQVRAGCDHETVRQTLQRIIDRDPKVAAAENARKRLDLLKLELKAKHKSQAVKLGSYEQKIGLKRGLPDQS